MRDHLASLIDDFPGYGHDIAVVRYQGNRRRITTYAELGRLARRFATLLDRRGIVAGDRVLLWGENSAEWIAAFHGCLLRGVLSVPLDAAGGADFVARVAADVQPKLAVGDALLLDHLSPKIPRLAFENFPAKLPQEESGPIAGLTGSTPLQILFTSGTTGDPKGIVITHGNVLSSVEPVEAASQAYLRYERIIHPLRILHTLPLSHVFGQTMGLWVPPIYRAELHFESRLVAPHMIDLIRRERISVLAAVPRVLALLKTDLEINHPGLAEKIATGQTMRSWARWWVFRKIHREFGFKFWAFVSGGGALAGPLEQFWNALGFVLVQGYGMTESTALITLNHPFHVARGTIGKPLAGRDVKLGPDGEVLVRGPMISGATWSGGHLQARQDEWLATGDIAERQPSGELKFLGRKSEVIVTANGLNLHPEDVESVIEEQPGIAACAVVAMETDAGPEPCAVLATRGSGDRIAEAVEHANAHLAEFQRIRRWMLYPEPDLPRTSTGKVKRKQVAAWLNRTHHNGSNGSNGSAHHNGSSGLNGSASHNGSVSGDFGAHSDWLLKLVAQVSGETPPGVGDELRLTEDLHFDSLGRVQLAAAIEERLGIVSGMSLLEDVHTLGELRQHIAGETSEQIEPIDEVAAPVALPTNGTPLADSDGARPIQVQDSLQTDRPPTTRSQMIYPTWPWWRVIRWVRIAFIEAVMRPLVGLLAAPRVILSAPLKIDEPILIVANHVSTFDGPLIQYALPGPIRRSIASAMLGEMLEDFRHWRNPEAPSGQSGFYLWGPAIYRLLTALFNVFPLPRTRDFQASFTHAGHALDHGYNVLVFPEGTRSAEGRLARFRPGIGILVKQSHTAVLPIGLRGLGELKTRERRWFRSGRLEVHVGEPISFAPEATEAEIAQRLQNEVARLMNE